MDNEALEKMLEQGQDNAMLRCTLGMLALKKERYETAVDHFEHALEMEPDHSASWKGYGKALVALEHWDEARRVFAKGIEVATARGDVQAVKEMQVFSRRIPSE